MAANTTHKHSFFIYEDGSGAYCMGCDLVLGLSEISNILNSYYARAQWIIRPSNCNCASYVLDGTHHVDCLSLPTEDAPSPR